MKNQIIISLAFFFTIFMIRPASSQTIEMSMVPDSISSLELDFAKLLISNSNQSLISGNFNLQYKHIFNEKFNLIGEFSYLYAKQKGIDADNGLSNIFLGFQYKTSQKDYINSALNVGIYVPTASDNIQTGAFINLFDLPKFLDEAISIYVGYNSFIQYTNGLRLGFELGSDVSIPIGDNNNDTELVGRYAFSLLYKSTSGLYLQSELLGIANITNDGEGFDESTFHTYSFGLGYSGSKMGAGLYYRKYFDDFFSEDFKGILGIELNLFL